MVGVCLINCGKLELKIVEGLFFVMILYIPVVNLYFLYWETCDARGQRLGE